ncbi:MAG: T9SS type A sorting domain-containing protein [Bacteroidales bacterium]|nr:T9SS type A sorting domain-containing protein [Bacteroidales bacterium]MCF8458337.1 T9SS type A sorting domain-containing protein [Bacteroidales bacterium]
MKNVLFPISFFFVLSISLNLQAQPNWYFTNTGSNHTILVQNSIPITIDGVQISTGDYLGVFFDSLGTQACGGYMQWTGITSTLAAWGTQSGNHDGFATGEGFTWKIWRASDASEYQATASYFSGTFPNGGNFTLNGMSGLASLVAIIPVPPSPGWYYEITNSQHSILIPNTISILLNGNPISQGDFLGVFYDSLGSMACGGYLSWTGQSDTLVAYGQTLGDNGFSTGEGMVWKIWRASNSVSAWADVSYDTQNATDSGSFVNGGSSKLASLSGISGRDLGISALIWPQNSCSNLSNSESIQLQFTNLGIGSVFDFKLFVSVNDTWFDTLIQVSVTIQPDSSTIVNLPLNIDLSDTGSFDFTFYLYNFGDLEAQNDSFNQLIHNFPLPELFIPSLDTAYCQSGNAPVMLTGFPAGGNFTGNHVLNDIFYPVTTGFSLIQYQFTDAQTGCSAILQQTVEVLASPQIDLGPNQTSCEGDTLILEAPAGFTSYQWSHTSGNSNVVEIVFSGNFSLTVTAENSCTDSDEIQITFHPLPNVQIEGDTAKCEGDSILLDAGFGFNFYTWQTEPLVYAQQIFVKNTGYYAVKVSKDNCSSVDSFFVEFYPLPDVEILGKDSACIGEAVKLDAGAGYTLYRWSNSMNNWGQSNTVYQSGAYSVTVTDANNCRGSDTIHVQFFPYPDSDLDPVPFLCIGDTVELSPGKADKYLWSTGETSAEILVLESGNYSFTITSKNCSSSKEINLTFFNPPDLSFSFEKEFNRVQFVNTSSMESNYRWFFGDGHESRIFEPFHEYADTGSYHVEMESINDCGYSVVSGTIHISDVDWGFSFKRPRYFPNPGNGVFNIAFSIYEDVELSYRLFDVHGETILSSTKKIYFAGENMYTLDLTSQGSGIYFIEWTSELGSFCDKLVLIRGQ